MSKEFDLDYWVLRGRKPARVGATWKIELEGPDPATGRWENASSDSQRRWNWRVLSPERLRNDPAAEAWEFSGDRPEFDIARKVWMFAGGRPELRYLRKGKPASIKFSIASEQQILMSPDSLVAFKHIEMFHDEAVRLISETAGGGDRRNSTSILHLLLGLSNQISAMRSPEEIESWMLTSVADAVGAESASLVGEVAQVSTDQFVTVLATSSVELRARGAVAIPSGVKTDWKASRALYSLSEGRLHLYLNWKDRKLPASDSERAYLEAAMGELKKIAGLIRKKAG